eukprot:gene17291-20577_t
MAVFGKTAVQLVQEVANMDGEGLPSFKEDVVKKVLDEVDEHHKALLNILSTVQDAGLEWNQMEANDANALMFFREYDKLLMEYQDPRTGVGIDLTLDMTPPKDHKIEVRVLADHGEIFSKDGPLILKRNTVHFLWREDAMPLIAE